ncbi:MAG: phosphate acyltransferase PlsX [bacterium]
MGNIVLDVMGGDNAPHAQVAGAVSALDNVSSEIYLVGDGAVIRKILRGFKHPRLHIVHASQVIKMDDKPARACKKYPDSSIMVGMKFLKENPASIFISAGNSGALMAAAVIVLERIPGILRPAIAVMARGIKEPFVLLDAGANTNCDWKQLCQFALMGSICASVILKISEPRIGLLSNGQEDSKGTDAVVAANNVLKKSDLNFVGNVEGGDVLSGKCDCVVCDGFVGNILLKFAEGFAGAVRKSFGSGSKDSFISRLSVGFAKKLFKRFDYSEYGATFLVGLNGNVMVTHGIANEKAIMNAVISAEPGIAARLNETIAREIKKYSVLMEL